MAMLLSANCYLLSVICYLLSSPHETTASLSRRPPALRRPTCSEIVARGTHWRGWIYPGQSGELPRAQRAAEGAGLVADAGLDRHRSGDLRPARAERIAREVHPRADRRASTRCRCVHAKEARRVHEALLGEPREPQRHHGAEVRAVVHAGGAVEGGAGRAACDQRRGADRGTAEEGAGGPPAGDLRSGVRAAIDGEESARRPRHHPGKREQLL